MNTELLIRLGLTDSQARTYEALIRAGQLTPPQLAKKIGESRTTAYMALAKLEEIGLAKKLGDVKKQTFVPTSPSQLNSYLETKRRELTEIEEQYRAGLPDMLGFYYAESNQPGLQYFQGPEGLKSIYKDHLQTGKDVYLVRTWADEKHFGKELYDYMEARANKGIKTIGLLPYDLKSMLWAKKNDKRLNRDVSWYPPEAYKAPVEIAIYGHKVSMISFGAEAIGVILESPQIAQALRELFGMAKVGAGQLMKSREDSVGMKRVKPITRML